VGLLTRIVEAIRMSSPDAVYLARDGLSIAIAKIIRLKNARRYEALWSVLEACYVDRTILRGLKK
jgi:hypothetical protein